MACTEKQRLRLLKRADTLHSKACELFELAEEIFGKDDERMIPYFGDAMCSADELRNRITYTEFSAGREALKLEDGR